MRSVRVVEDEVRQCPREDHHLYHPIDDAHWCPGLPSKWTTAKEGDVYVWPMYDDMYHEEPQ